MNTSRGSRLCRTRTVALVLAVGLFPRPGLAQTAALPPELDVIPRDAFLFVSARVGDLWTSEPVKAVRLFLPPAQLKPLQDFEKSLGLTLGDLDRVSLVIPTNGPSADRPILFATATKPYDRARVVQTLADGAAEVKHAGRGFYPIPGPQWLGALHLFNDRTVVLGKMEDVTAVLARSAQPASSGAQAEALALADKKHHVVVGVNGAFLRQNVPANMPLEAQRFLPLMAMTHAAVNVDLTKQGVQSTIRMNFMGENQARAGESAVKDLLALGRDVLKLALRELPKETQVNPQVKEAQRRLEGWLAGIPVKLDGTTVVVTPSVKQEEITVVIGLLLPAVQKVREAANRLVSQNNLKQLGLAMHNYHDEHNRLPAQALRGKDGKPLLSWRVALLPYLEEDALYKQFKLDEPWDSAHNKKLLARMPRVYAHPAAAAQPGLTFYQVFAGPDTPFGSQKGGVFAQIPDGLSNTLLAVEAAQAVPWTKPDDLPFDMQKPLPKLGGHFTNGFNVLFCDGSVRFLPRNLPENTLRLLINRHDGMAIPDLDR